MERRGVDEVPVERVQSVSERRDQAVVVVGRLGVGDPFGSTCRPARVHDEVQALGVDPSEAFRGIGRIEPSLPLGARPRHRDDGAATGGGRDLLLEVGPGEEEMRVEVTNDVLELLRRCEVRECRQDRPDASRPEVEGEVGGTVQITCANSIAVPDARCQRPAAPPQPG
jgi:hypothetical protein